MSTIESRGPEERLERGREVRGEPSQTESPLSTLGVLEGRRVKPLELSEIQSFVEISQILTNVEEETKGLEKSLSIASKQNEIRAIKSKIIEVYTKIKSEREMNVDDYLQLSNLLFKLKKLSPPTTFIQEVFNFIFTPDRALNQIEVECIKQIHDQPQLMKTILQGYDQLAQTLNQLIDQSNRTGVVSEEIQPMLYRLEYYNSIIGIPWSEEQKGGRSVVPLWEEQESSSAVTRSMKLEDCQGLTALYGLVLRISESERSGRYRDKVVIPGVGEYRYDQIESLIHKFAKEELGRYPFAKGKTAYTVCALINTIRLMNPRSSKESSELDRLENQCLDIVKQDQEKMILITRRYDRLAKEMNTVIRNTFVKQYLYDKKINSLLELQFLSKFLNVKLSHHHMNQSELFPLVQQPSNPFKAIIRYSQLSAIINQEIEVRQKVRELQRLQFQVAPQNLLSDIMAPEEKKRINERIDELKEWLTAKFKIQEAYLAFERENLEGLKLPEPFFQSMLKECEQYANFLNVEFSDAQRVGQGMLPKIDFNTEREGYFYKPTLHTLPVKVDFLNKQIQYFNDYFKYKKLKQESRQNEKDIIALRFDVFSPRAMELLNRKEELDRAIKKLEDKHRISFKDDREMLYWMNKMLIPYIRSFNLIRLTEAQASGMEEIPIMDITTLPLPSKEDLLRSIEEHCPPDLVKKLIKTFPPAWVQLLGQATPEHVEPEREEVGEAIIESALPAQEGVSTASSEAIRSYAVPPISDEELDRLMEEWEEFEQLKEGDGAPVVTDEYLDERFSQFEQPQEGGVSVVTDEVLDLYRRWINLLPDAPKDQLQKKQEGPQGISIKAS